MVMVVMMVVVFRVVVVMVLRMAKKSQERLGLGWSLTQVVVLVTSKTMSVATSVAITSIPKVVSDAKASMRFGFRLSRSLAKVMVVVMMTSESMSKSSSLPISSIATFMTIKELMRLSIPSGDKMIFLLLFSRFFLWRNNIRCNLSWGTGYIRDFFFTGRSLAIMMTPEMASKATMAKASVTKDTLAEASMAKAAMHEGICLSWVDAGDDSSECKNLKELKYWSAQAIHHCWEKSYFLMFHYLREVFFSSSPIFYNGRRGIKTSNYQSWSTFPLCQHVKPKFKRCVTDTKEHCY